MYEGLNDAIFLLLNRGHVIRVEATSIERVAERVDEDNEYDGDSPNPIHVKHSLLHVRVLTFHRLLRLPVQGLNVGVSALCLEATIGAPIRHSWLFVCFHFLIIWQIAGTRQLLLFLLYLIIICFLL